MICILLEEASGLAWWKSQQASWSLDCIVTICRLTGRCTVVWYLSRDTEKWKSKSGQKNPFIIVIVSCFDRDICRCNFHSWCGLTIFISWFLLQFKLISFDSSVKKQNFLPPCNFQLTSLSHGSTSRKRNNEGGWIITPSFRSSWNLHIKWLLYGQLMTGLRILDQFGFWLVSTCMCNCGHSSITSEWLGTGVFFVSTTLYFFPYFR